MTLRDIVKILTKRAFPLFRKSIKTVTIDGMKLKYVYIDKGTPYTIVFENGLGTGFSFWDKTFLELSKEYSVFAYNRPFKEDMKINKEKDWTQDDCVNHAHDIVNQLKFLLDKCGVGQSYILVGHSLGGLYIQHFTKEYPSEVKAMVLVDAPYPDEFADLDAMKVPSKLRKQMELVSKNATRMSEMLLTSPITKQIPIVVLSALLKKELEEKPEMKEMIDFMHNKQKEYLTLYPWAKQIWVDTSHMVMYDKPEVVVDAIKDVICEIK